MSAAERSAATSRVGSGWSIDAIIDEQAVHTVYQPIVHLASGSIAGFEALSRGPAGTALESPLALIHAAKQAGRLGELDWLCRTRAMHMAAEAELPDTLSWLVNVEPAGLAMDCPAHLVAAQERARLDLRVILEIVERDVQGNVLDLIRATDDARFGSWGVALDDVGAEEASLALLPFLRPDVVKLDMSVTQGVPCESTASITAAVRAYAERRGAVIVAEGIETYAHEQQAKVFGATYGQGYYYGRPGPLPISVDVPVAPIPLRQYMAPLDGRTPFEILSTTLEPQRVQKQHLIHITAHLENRAADRIEASVLLAGFQNRAFFTAAKRARYRELSASNALAVVLADGLTREDEPAYYVRPLPPGSALGAEWIVIVLSPHFAAALVARDCGDTGPDAQRQFDFIYTHDRDTVINAARSFIQDLASESSHRDAPIGAHRETMPDPPSLDSLISAVPAESYGFRATAQAVLDYLNAHLPMSYWSITRVENEQQTYLYLDDNDYGLTAGGSHPWRDSYCVHMVAGTAPRIAPDAAAIPLYAAAAVNQAVQIGAYAGAPIAEPDGSLFGAICGLDRLPRHDMDHFGPILDLLSEVLSISLATDRALHRAQAESNAALTYATTDSLTGIHNRHGWDTKITQLDLDFATYADPTVIVIVDLDNLKQINDGPGGHSAGDQLLRDAARVMRRYQRDDDFLARLGGDEFGIILTNTPADLAPTIGARMTRELDRAGIPASVGWSPLLPDGTVQTAVRLADEAMYQAKRHRKSTPSTHA